MGSPSNFQLWEGVEDSRYGYGSMLAGFRSAVPPSVVFDGSASVSVYMGVPYGKTTWLKNQHRVLFTMWETSELPDRFRHHLQTFDQILVPCDHNVELFGRYHPDVQKVPLGVESTVWTPRTVERSGVFRFHAGGSLWRRKGLDATIQAFLKADIPNAELHVKIAPHVRDAPADPPTPNVVFHREWMTDQEQYDWFTSADCYVAASRGEGWGLMPLQAIAAGIPTILSDSTGHREFLALATKTVGTTPVPADTIGLWDEPNQDELIDAMRWMVTHRQEAHQTAQEARTTTQKYSWSKATRQLLKAIPRGVLLEDQTPVYPMPEIPCTVTRKVRAYIATDVVHLDPGPAVIPLNVFEVLSESGAVTA